MSKSDGIVVILVALMILQVSQGKTTPCQGEFIQCAPDCDPYLDAGGCPKCDCHFTCEMVDCLEGYICEMQVKPCLRPPCPVGPVCVPMATNTPRIPEVSTTKCTSEISCGKGCQVLVDSDGCPYCDCPLTCETTECKDGYDCKMEVIPCLIAPCPTRPTCVPRITTTPCPRITCTKPCETVKTQDGCKKCSCPRTCKDIECTKDQKCVLKKVQCFAPPCFPIPTCVPKND